MGLTSSSWTSIANCEYIEYVLYQNNVLLTWPNVFLSMTVATVLISDVVRLSGTYLILLIRIRLYLCRLDYIFYCTYRLGYPYCPSLLGRLIVLSLLFPLGTFLLFPMDYCLV